jgi:hypothetical protein
VHVSGLDPNLDQNQVPNPSCQWLGFGFGFDPQLFYTYFYNHAHRLRLEKLFYIELFNSSNGFLKPLLDPGDGSNTETAERWFQK